MCGKNVALAGIAIPVWGSPPRVREKPSDTSSMIVAIGITPACAGKTKVPVTLRGLVRDHPRVCGKNTSALTKMRYLAGSPPRVREKH